METLSGILGSLNQGVEALNTQDLYKFHPGKKDEKLYTMKSASPMDVVKAIQLCKHAEKKWAKVSSEKRAEILIKVAETLEAKASQLALEEAKQQGIALDFVKENSVLGAAKIFRFWASFICNRCEPSPSHEFQYQPLSLVAIFPAWTLSLRLLAERLAPALAAGNTCIVKSSSKSPASGERLIKILFESGLPTGVCSLLHGPGKELLPLLTAHPAVKGVSFVGREKVGTSLMKYIQPTTKRIQLAMEAKNSAIVLEDVAVDSCVKQLAQACFIGQGQMAWNIHRIFVAKKTYPLFKEAFLNELKSLQLGHVEENRKFQIGPMIHKNAFDLTQKTLEQMKIEQGKVLIGGKAAEVSEGQNFFFTYPHRKPFSMLSFTTASLIGPFGKPSGSKVSEGSHRVDQCN